MLHRYRFNSENKNWAFLTSYTWTLFPCFMESLLSIQCNLQSKRCHKLNTVKRLFGNICVQAFYTTSIHMTLNGINFNSPTVTSVVYWLQYIENHRLSTVLSIVWLKNYFVSFSVQHSYIAPDGLYVWWSIIYKGWDSLIPWKDVINTTLFIKISVIPAHTTSTALYLINLHKS